MARLGDRDQGVDVRRGRDRRVVGGARHGPTTQRRHGEVRPLERGVGGHEGVDGVYASRGGAERGGRGGGAFEADFLARAPDEDHRVLELGTIEVAQRQDLRRIPHAVVERAARGARAGEPHVLLGHRHRAAGRDAEGDGGGARAGTDVHTEGRRGVAREGGIAGQEDARHVAARGVDQGGLPLEQRMEEPATGSQRQGAVAQNRVHQEADLVQVRHEDHHRVALAEPDPQVAGAVGVGLHPRRQQPLHRLAHRPLGTGDAVGFDEGRKHRLRLSNSRRVLSG